MNRAGFPEGRLVRAVLSTVRIAGCAFLAAMFNGCGETTAPRNTAKEIGVNEVAGDWHLVWSDEFDGPRLDSSRWTVEEMAHPPNSEVQYYTSRVDDDPGANVFLRDGHLVIEARSERFGERNYTSGRINTRGKHDFLYGRYEARMKFPSATGTWPAFWLLGSTFATDGWPLCGEIDIAEGKGRLPNWVAGAAHGGASPQEHWNAGRDYVLADGSFQDEWHALAVEWDPGEIRWWVDDTMFHSLRGPEDPASDPVGWPFGQGHPFFIIINLALGGWFDAPHGPPEVMRPQQLLVDYVRVYRRAEDDGNPPVPHRIRPEE